MRTFRRIAAIAALGGLAAFAVPGPARAQETGTGTAGATATVLGLDLSGGAVSVRVLTDDSGATTQQAPEAFVALSPLTLTTPVEALNINQPAVEVRSTGGEQSQSTDALPINTPVLSGTILPATLSAVVDASGAKGVQSTAVEQLVAGGGLLTVEGVTNGLTAGSAGSGAESARGLVVDQVAALDLGAVLDGLGLSLASLPVQDLLDLLGELGVPVPGVGDVTDVTTAIATVNAAIDDLQGTTGDLTEALCTTVDTTLGGIGGIGEVIDVTCTTVETTTTTVNATVDALQLELADLLGQVLATLDGVTLLSAEGLTVGMIAKATDSIDTSVADVAASLGAITVGGTTLPVSLDVASTLETITGVADQITGTVNGVLAQVHPGLGSLVDVSLFEQTESVTESNGVVNAVAGITALRATITPPAELAAIVSTVLGAADSVTEVITGLGGTVPQLSTAMTTLEQALGLVQGLTEPAALTVGTLSVSAAHAVAATAAPGTPTGGELPRTGTTAAVTAFGGVLLAGAAIGIRRWLRATAPQL